MQPRPLTDDEVQNTLTAAIRDAVDFIEAEIAPARIKAHRYFEGGVGLGSEDGRSKVVATKCRDTVRAIKPVLMRVFLQTDKPVEFVPRSPAAVQSAQQATSYASWVFAANDGYHVLLDVFHDALVKKVGIVKATYDETDHFEVDSYTLRPEVEQFLLSTEPDLEVVERAENEDGTVSLTVGKTVKKGRIKFDSVAPEDFFVDRDAKGIRDYFVCGHRSEVRVGDVVAMGYDFETVYAESGTSDTITDDAEEFERRGYDDEDDEGQVDPSMRRVLLTEAYMRMDIQGTGIPREYRFICVGEDYVILDRQLCDMNPFAVFEVDPEPHTFFGRSLVDIVLDDQDAATSLLRGLLDSIAFATNPRLEVVEDQVNVEDVLNNEIGAILRVKQPGMVREIGMGNAAVAALPAIQYFDEVTRAKTGVVGAAMGMDADALQSQTATGVDAAVQAATAQAELIARNLAEGGMRQLFEKIAALARQHPDPEGMIRVDGQFVQVDPRSWTAPMDVICNVGLGTGRHQERLAMLQSLLQTQMAIWAQGGGPNNGLVSLTNIRATLADMLGVAGIHNADRYILPMTPEREAQVIAQAQAGKPSPMDPNQAFLQAEAGKATMKAQTDMMRLQLEARKAQADDDRERDQMEQELALKTAKAQADDDRERDQMEQELALKTAELMGKHVVAVNTQAIKAAQAAPRPFGPPNI